MEEYTRFVLFSFVCCWLILTYSVNLCILRSYFIIMTGSTQRFLESCVFIFTCHLQAVGRFEVFPSHVVNVGCLVRFCRF